MEFVTTARAKAALKLIEFIQHNYEGFFFFPTVFEL